MQMEEVVYTRLVRMFYANLQINVEGTTLFFRVNGVDIVVNPYVLLVCNIIKLTKEPLLRV